MAQDPYPNNDAARVESLPPPLSMPPPRHSYQHQHQQNTATTLNDAPGVITNHHHHHYNFNNSSNNDFNNSFPANTTNNANNNNANNNNNNNINANQQMERVTFHLHSRLCNFGLAHTSYRTRKIFEHLLLVIAICCAGALLMLHRTFVVSAVTSASAANTAAVLSSTSTSTSLPVVSTCLDRLEGFDPAAADITHLVILPHNLTIGTNATVMIDGSESSKSKVLWNRVAHRNRNRQTTTATECAAHFDDSEQEAEEDPEQREYRKWLDQQLASNTLPIKYSYSTTKAYLMLPYDHSWIQDHHLDVQYVLVAPTDPVCFGEPFVQFLLWNCFIGGNTVLLNWLRTFPAHEDVSNQHQHNRKQPSKGYVYNPRTNWLKEVGRDNQATRKAREGSNNNKSNTGNNNDSNQHSSSTSLSTSSSSSLSLVSSKWNTFLAKLGVFLRTSFLFFFCTTLVSFTLRETQERMLDFTRELSRRVRQSISLSDLITTHLVQNLVFVPIMLGMMFFLIEFYHGDKFLAFSITSIVWSVETYSLVCLRSSQGLQYFPYFFFLLFLLFHVYQTAFQDNGFVYLALTVVWCFMLHSMVFFWHRYELPALVLGAVSVHRPRMNSSVDEYTNNNNHGEYNGEVSSGSGAAVHSTHGRSGSFGASNGMAAPSVTRGATSIEGNHLTAPLLMTSTEAATSATSTTSAATSLTTTRNSSSLLSGNGGGAGTGFLASRQSFQSSASSRRTSGLYQLNQEDDSSTGSHLYFMGGEVVVHQRQTPVNHSNSQSNPNPNSHSSSSELSPPAIRRGNSFGNVSAVGAPSTEEESSMMARPLSSFIRNESNFSLMSSSSDAYAHALANNNNNNTLAIGLDVTGRWSGDSEDDLVATNIHSSFCDPHPNDTSIETVETSNVSTPPKKSQSTNHALNGNDGGISAIPNTATTMPSDGCYAEESGGLQAILETKLTPRHRNTNQRPIMEQEQTTLTMSSPDSSSSPAGIPYQRSPPNFPELTQPN
jgi:hypothetical protein